MIRIGVDLDSTLNNLEEVWIQRYNQDYDDNLTVENMIDWDPTKYVKPECGIKIFDYLKEPGFFRNLDIKPHGRDVMEFLHDHFDVYIVTSSHPKTVGDKWDWVEQHLPFIPSKNFIPLHEKHLFDIHYLVDDGPHNFEKFKGTGILIDMPHNRHVRNRYIRVNSLLEVKRYFRQIIRKRETLIEIIRE